MNKQEAIEEIKKQSTQAYDDFAIMRDTAIHIVNQIDEPQKPVVPKFVVEWIEWCKANNVTLLGGISPIDELGSAICGEKRIKSRNAVRWAEQSQETFARAWLDGYEIEKEKLYTVEIPNPALNNLEFVIVLKRIRGRVCLVNTYDYMGRELSDEYKLTEAEIKQDFEWAWQWAKEVE